MRLLMKLINLNAKIKLYSANKMDNKRETLKVGIVQQANGADIETNIANLEANICNCAANGAELVVLQELHNSLYFCQTEDVGCLIWLNQYLAHRQSVLALWLKN